MIRDPSDGSVKEINLPASEINDMVARKPSEGITSDLPDIKEKTDELIRLEKSREWLENYRTASTSQT